MRLRNRVREAREARGLTQTALADSAGMSRPTLRAVEADDGYEPYGWVMTALSQVLGDPELFWWEQTPEPAETPA